MKCKILDVCWWTPASPWLGAIVFAPDGPVIGIVAIESYAPEGHWKAYIGLGTGNDEERDAEYIARVGMPLGNAQAAAAFFPQLDVKKYKY